MRILVQILHVRVSRCAIEVEVVLFHVLAMVAFAVGQPEEPLFQDRIFSVPHSYREAQYLVVIADSGQPILTPAIGPRSGLIVA